MQNKHKSAIFGAFILLTLGIINESFIYGLFFGSRIVGPIIWISVGIFIWVKLETAFGWEMTTNKETKDKGVS
ncbi:MULTISPECIES: hypothetical protein [Bacillaceae]|uniref:Uncharacterized protein n=1 Tax=Evansella alkalicola TaxID=745819 RepID=A0ABS6K0T4_9BACI|nr:MULTISPECIES: hypothetical protein [Bacillaceae]MBU9724270.1 hypothetical protein [Bacillus alkalicola]